MRLVSDLLHSDVRYVDFRRELFGSWFELTSFENGKWRKISLSHWDYDVDNGSVKPHGGPRISWYFGDFLILADIVEVGRNLNICFVPNSIFSPARLNDDVLGVASDINILTISSSRNLIPNERYPLQIVLSRNTKDGIHLGVKLHKSGKIELNESKEYREMVAKSIARFSREQLL